MKSQMPQMIATDKGGISLHNLQRNPTEPRLDVSLRTPKGETYRITKMAQFKSLQHLPQDKKDELLLASMQSVDYVEMPSYIFVETRFITKHSSEFAEFAAEMHAMESGEMYQSVPISLNSPISHLNSPLALSNDASVTTVTAPVVTAKSKPKRPKVLKTFANATVYATVVRKECGTETELDNPVRERCQQTDQKSVKEAAIQCEIEVDLDFAIDAEGEDAINPIDIDSDPLIFKTFVCENTIYHSSGMLECRLCGEVQRKMESFEAHLLLHFGPPTLCFRCGLQFEHQALMRRHVCVASDRKPRAARLRCPHYRCGVVAISLLELYDHINEHCSDNCYVCKQCGSAYPTATELLEHSKLRSKCRRSKLCSPYRRLRLQSAGKLLNIKRVQLIYGLKDTKALRVSRLDRCGLRRLFKRCQICFKICGNDFQFRRHRKRCLIKYLQRLKKLRQKEEEKTEKENNGVV